MTLKEQFDNVEIMFENQIGTLKYDELSEASNECVKIAENFAIDFLKWYDNLSDYFYEHTEAETYIDFLELYKIEKGL